MVQTSFKLCVLLLICPPLKGTLTSPNGIVNGLFLTSVLSVQRLFNEMTTHVLRFPCLKMPLFRFVCDAVSMDMHFRGTVACLQQVQVPHSLLSAGLRRPGHAPPFSAGSHVPFSSAFSQFFFLTLIFGHFPNVLSSLSCVDFAEVLERMSY